MLPLYALYGSDSISLRIYFICAFLSLENPIDIVMGPRKADPPRDAWPRNVCCESFCENCCPWIDAGRKDLRRKCSLPKKY